MNRRGFLQSILAAGVAPAVVRIGSLMPVKVIALPTEKQVWQYASGDLAIGVDEFAERALESSGCTLLTPSMITREALIILENNLVMANRFNGRFDAWKKSGDTLIVRRPQTIFSS